MIMRILFICTGNLCRSAAAEAVLKKMIEDKGISNICVASCGTEVSEGLERDQYMCSIAAEHGYDMGGKAIPMSETLLNSADLIIVMAERHKNELTALLDDDHRDRVVRFNDYCFNEASDLPDPYFQTDYVYRTCFDKIERGCNEIIKKLTVANEK